MAIKEDLRIAIDQLSASLDSIAEFRNLLQAKLGVLDSSDSSRKERRSARLEAEGLLVLYDFRVRSLLEAVDVVHDHDAYESDSDVPTGTFTLALGGQWLTHELARMVGSLTFLANLFIVQEVARIPQQPRSLYRGPLRENVIKGAEIFYYVDRRDELQIRRLHISSPGSLELFTQNPEVAFAISALVGFLIHAPRLFDRLIESWRKFRDTLREQRAKDRHERVTERLYEFLERELEKLSQTQREIHKRGDSVERLREAILQISRAELADALELTDRTLGALASLVRLVEEEKIRAISRNGKP